MPLGFPPGSALFCALRGGECRPLSTTTKPIVAQMSFEADESELAIIRGALERHRLLTGVHAG